MLVEKGLGGVLGGLQGWRETNVDLKFGMSLLAVRLIRSQERLDLTFWGQIHLSSVILLYPALNFFSLSLSFSFFLYFCFFFLRCMMGQSPFIVNKK